MVNLVKWPIYEKRCLFLDKVMKELTRIIFLRMRYLGKFGLFCLYTKPAQIRIEIDKRHLSFKIWCLSRPHLECIQISTLLILGIWYFVEKTLCFDVIFALNYLQLDAMHDAARVNIFIARDQFARLNVSECFKDLSHC